LKRGSAERKENEKKDRAGWGNDKQEETCKSIGWLKKYGWSGGVKTREKKTRKLTSARFEGKKKKPLI